MAKLDRETARALAEAGYLSWQDYIQEFDVISPSIAAPMPAELPEIAAVPLMASRTVSPQPLYSW